MEDKIFSPVVIPTLCRYEYFIKLIESLKKCKESIYTELVIGLDYPPQEKYIYGWKKIKEYIPSITGFKKVTVFEATSNLGADDNSDIIINYVKEKGYTSFIYSEDDNVFAPNFLSYMNWGLNKFQNNKNVMAICGYNYPIDMSSYNKTYYFSHNFAGWGFGIWTDTHIQLKNEVYNKSYCRSVLFNPINLYKIAHKRGLRIILSIYRCYRDNQIHWDTFLTTYQYLRGRYSVFPSTTMVLNLGQDGSGIHSTYSELNIQKYSQQKLDINKEFNPTEDIPLADNMEIEKASLQHFNVNHFNFKKFLPHFFRGK